MYIFTDPRLKVPTKPISKFITFSLAGSDAELHSVVPTPLRALSFHAGFAC